MSESLFSHQHSISVNAAPDAVYNMVSDLTRHGEWSPQNVGGEWIDGGTGKVGDWFAGNNKAGKMEWTANVEVTEATPGAEFGFWTLGKKENVCHWSYSMEAEGSGTKLTQHYSVYNLPDAIANGMGLEGWSKAVTAGMETNLAAIKTTAEAAG